MRKKLLLIVLLLFFAAPVTWSQTEQWWHGVKRSIHYKPSGKDFQLVNGERRFNRALYGGNTAFRAEAGDLPEFALYLPGMGGNLKFGLLKNSTGKWLIKAGNIESVYRPGAMIYTITDSILGKGSIKITALPLFTSEGLIVKVEGENISDANGISVVALYGGATGQKFSRDGDIGADPESSFYLKPDYCKTNKYIVKNNGFTLFYGSSSLSEQERYEIQQNILNKPDTTSRTKELKIISGIFPSSSVIKIVDAAQQQSPASLLESANSKTPAISSVVPLAIKPLYYLILNGVSSGKIYETLPALFDQQEKERKKLAGRIAVETPDPYINTIGGALSIAADAIWEDPSYMHGAVAWRMRLNGWRGAYVADVLGWHERARNHFSSYALSQLRSPSTGPVVLDTALHLARALEKLGTSLFSSGYISRNPGGDFRPHHYDMNLVFIDQLINHFYWTGDTSFLRSMWPVLTRHFDWEKRNFDKDSDGLYDAYAAIWASDALQYSGGGVAHSSAYNYRSNKIAAYFAKLLGENGSPYQKEADKIIGAIQKRLWLPSGGWYGEYKDLSGEKLVHPSAALWTVYHLLDSDVPDRFQSYQVLKYVDEYIPHIPIRALGLKDSGLYTLSTTNWQPYTWSLNNVALGELMHTSLAYWLAGRSEEAYRLWKSTLVESMYLSASPGNFEQISFYDAARGELYRDFADGIGMTGRSLVEGLFGIKPDLLNNTLLVQPGFPMKWDHASIKTPDITYSFIRNNNVDVYKITTHFNKDVRLILRAIARKDHILKVVVNGNEIKWRNDSTAVGNPVIEITTSLSTNFTVAIEWTGATIKPLKIKNSYYQGEEIKLSVPGISIETVFDPQHTLTSSTTTAHLFHSKNRSGEGVKTFFIKVRQGEIIYWQPVSFSATEPVIITAVNNKEGIAIHMHNATGKKLSGQLFVNNHPVEVAFSGDTELLVRNNGRLMSGSNDVSFSFNGSVYHKNIINWDIINNANTVYEKINLDHYFNDQLTSIFRNQYSSPRPAVSTLQLPTQGIGNWAYPLVTASINDSGLRKRAGANNQITIQQGIPFHTPSTPDTKNIVFTSKWDVYPARVSIPLNGKASHAYLLMAGSTNAMQSRITNGIIEIQYSDGSTDSLQLRNPENWWPIEQDYMEDGYAFTTGSPRPIRIYLKTGEDTRTFNHYTSIKGFTSRAIDGGAATVLDLSLDGSKELKSLSLDTLANDVVIGLMSVTLVRQ